MVAMSPRSKASALIRDFYKACKADNSLKVVPDRPPFVYYEKFKDFIIKTKGADGHTIRAYRDQLLAFKFIEIDYIERVFFTFLSNPDYEKQRGLTQFGGD